MNLKRVFRGPWVWIAIILVLVVVTLQFSGSADGYREVRTSTMVTYLDDDKIADMTFVEGDQEIRATLDDDTQVRTKFLAGQGDRLVEQAEAAVEAKTLKEFNVEVPQPGFLASILPSLLLFALFIGVLFFMISRMQGGGGGVMKFAKSRAKLITKDTPQTTFADVAGCDEAI